MDRTAENQEWKCGGYSVAKIIRDDGRCPKNLQIDMGKEFYNANVQKFLKKHNHFINIP